MSAVTEVLVVVLVAKAWMQLLPLCVVGCGRVSCSIVACLVKNHQLSMTVQYGFTVLGVHAVSTSSACFTASIQCSKSTRSYANRVAVPVTLVR